MPNLGEEIAGQYLKYCEGCEFIDYNVSTTEHVGEIDVVGINAKKKRIFLCEVAIHLETGLQYTHNNRPVNVERLTNKFYKDIDYGRQYFPEYELKVMLWSPIIKSTKEGSKYNQMFDIVTVKQNIKEKYNLELITVINHEYFKALEELRAIAVKTTEELKSPVMRYLQIEEKLKKHIKKLE